MLEDRIEDGPGSLCQLRYEQAEFTVEVAQEQQRLVAQNGEARVVDRADRILCLEQLRHQGWKLFRHRFCVGWRFKRKGQG